MLDELNDQLELLATGVTVTGSNEHGNHVRLAFRIGEVTVGLDWFRRAAVTPSTASRLVQEHPLPGFAVGDIIHSDATETLRRHGWSFCDRRGRLRLDVNGLRSLVTGASGQS